MREEEYIHGDDSKSFVLTNSKTMGKTDCSCVI